ncbi:expressed unknown protein [Seminavis robusta]|uniref:MYND-type domain-containing protein n=1 Tax=Seminavis robusta TaxID=568900 RepID=A0A9N8HV22_9STRA|nr:expressed unknown protein [Seminavis robusta]|eukprot:Sro1729_g294020.1 n/a (741) ;mRNA; r:5246-7621
MPQQWTDPYGGLIAVPSAMEGLGHVLIEQSYHLACSTFDEPQLCILAITVLCTLSRRFPVGIGLLIKLSQTSDLARARVASCCIANQVPCEVNIDSDFVSVLLEDIRLLIRRRHNNFASLLVEALPALAPLVCTKTGCPQQSFELVYLYAEHIAEKGDHWKVISIPEIFSDVWQRQLEDVSLKKYARPIYLCIAKSLEATGDLSKAREIFASCGVPDLQDLDACIQGRMMYASIEASLPLKDITDLDARMVEGGNVAIFFHQKRGDKDGLRGYHVQMNMIDSGTGELVNIPLPDQSARRWKAVRVVPDAPSSALRVLVSSANCTDGEDDGIDLMSFMIEDMMPKKGALTEKVELWEFRGNRWFQIKTRGCIPDSQVVTRVGSACAVLGPFLVVFGGADMMTTRNRGARTMGESSAAAYLLDTRSREWFRVAHPYKHSWFTGPCPPDHICVSLPVFQAVWDVEVNGEPMIAMLRKGRDEVNEKRSEKVPKYALDLFRLLKVDGKERPEVIWHLTVAAKDRCGYLASQFRAQCHQFGNTSLVLAPSVGSMIEKVGADGKSTISYFDKGGSHGSPTSILFIDALDMSRAEWRGVKIHNAKLLRGDINYKTQYKLVPSMDPTMCYVLVSSGTSYKLCRICNLDSINECFTESLTDRNRHSRKNTVGYQLEKAHKNSCRPMRECALCRGFERGTDKFKCCSRCRVVFYCSRRCQLRSWKEEHKSVCTPVGGGDQEEAEEQYEEVD